MTTNQLAWLAQQETQRANVAREMETHRANVAAELEKQRANMQSEALKAAETQVKATEADTARRAQERQAEHYEIQELNDSLNSWGKFWTGLLGGLLI